jgi:hypothetical protein
VSKPTPNFWINNQAETENQPGLCNGARAIERGS